MHEVFMYADRATCNHYLADNEGELDLTEHGEEKREQGLRLCGQGCTNLESVLVGDSSALVSFKPGEIDAGALPGLLRAMARNDSLRTLDLTRLSQAPTGGLATTQLQGDDVAALVHFVSHLHHDLNLRISAKALTGAQAKALQAAAIRHAGPTITIDLEGEQPAVKQEAVSHQQLVRMLASEPEVALDFLSSYMPPGGHLDLSNTFLGARAAGNLLAFLCSDGAKQLRHVTLGVVPSFAPFLKALPDMKVPVLDLRPAVEPPSTGGPNSFHAGFGAGHVDLLGGALRMQGRCTTKLLVHHDAEDLTLSLWALRDAGATVVNTSPSASCLALNGGDSRRIDHDLVLPRLDLHGNTDTPPLLKRGGLDHLCALMRLEGAVKSMLRLGDVETLDPLFELEGRHWYESVDLSQVRICRDRDGARSESPLSDEHVRALISRIDHPGTGDLALRRLRIDVSGVGAALAQQLVQCCERNGVELAQVGAPIAPTPETPAQGAQPLPPKAVVGVRADFTERFVTPIRNWVIKGNAVMVERILEDPDTSSLHAFSGDELQRLRDAVKSFEKVPSMAAAVKIVMDLQPA